jgi:hypothetical protein
MDSRDRIARPGTKAPASPSQNRGQPIQLPRPDGAPVPWDMVGRRIGSLGHQISRFNGGDNTRENLVWSCLWCNTWLGERRPGATDHGGYFLAVALLDFPGYPARLVVVYCGLVAGNGQANAFARFSYRLLRTGGTGMIGDLRACRDTRQVSVWLDIERQSFPALGLVGRRCRQGNRALVTGRCCASLVLISHEYQLSSPRTAVYPPNDRRSGHSWRACQLSVRAGRPAQRSSCHQTTSSHAADRAVARCRVLVQRAVMRHLVPFSGNAGRGSRRRG